MASGGSTCNTPHWELRRSCTALLWQLRVNPNDSLSKSLVGRGKVIRRVLPNTIGHCWRSVVRVTHHRASSRGGSGGNSAKRRKHGQQPPKLLTPGGLDDLNGRTFKRVKASDGSRFTI